MTRLLSRVAEHVYWAARYLERAEDTARIVREYTNLIIDLPASATPGWEPLLAILDQEPPGVEPADATGPSASTSEMRVAPDRTAPPALGESAIVELLVSAPGNRSSIVQCVGQARENLRRCREVIPSEAWIAVNDLHLFATTSGREGRQRRNRNRFLDRIIAEHQRMIGILASNMVRDSAFTLMRLGRHVERADMTTRLIDVWAGPLLVAHPDRADVNHQWIGLLRALSAVQMYHRTRQEPMSATVVVSFMLHAANFPRSVAFCLEAARQDVRRLPGAELTVAAADGALAALNAFDPSAGTAERLHEMAKVLQQAISQLHGHLDAVYFHKPGETT